MKRLTVVLAILIAIVLVGSAFAVGPGKNVEYAGGDKGKVVFSGDTHKVNKCADCHPKLFQMKKAMKMTMADHATEQGCGSCHNGKNVFGQTDEASCAKCHKK
jgi:c(7)-type cytochrome triheme protein